jgi:hypothetical protein
MKNEKLERTKYLKNNHRYEGNTTKRVLEKQLSNIQSENMSNILVI